MNKKQSYREKSIVAIPKYVCPCCGNTFEDGLLISKRLDKDISDLHGEVIGFSDHLCPVCQDIVDKGAVVICVIDGDKSQSDSLNNIYRAGIVVGLKREAFERLMDATVDDFAEKLREFEKHHHFIFMDYHSAADIGIDVNSYLEHINNNSSPKNQ